MIEEGDKEIQDPISTTGGDDSPNRQRSESTAGNDGTPVLTPGPKEEQVINPDETISEIEENNHKKDSSVELTRSVSPNPGFNEKENLDTIEEGNGSGSELNDKEASDHENDGSDHESVNEGPDHEGDGEESDHESGDEESELDDKEKSDHGDDGGESNHEDEEPDHGGSSLGGTGADAGYLLGGFITQSALPDLQRLLPIGYPQLPQIGWDQIKGNSPDSVKNFLPEKIEFSPEMQFAGGVFTGKAINPTIRYVNDQLSGNNKDKSFLDYYSCKGFSISGTLESFASSVGKSYIAFHGMELFKSHGIELLKSYISDNTADALIATISYCKTAFPMTFTAGLIVTTAPQAMELGLNLMSSGCNKMVSLAGLSSSDNDADL